MSTTDDESKSAAMPEASEQLRAMAHAAIENHPAIASLLYDIDLLPEQIKHGDVRREGYMADVVHAMLEMINQRDEGKSAHTYEDGLEAVVAHACDESLEPRNRLQGVCAMIRALKAAREAVAWLSKRYASMAHIGTEHEAAINAAIARQGREG